MPQLSRIFIKTSLAYLVASFAFGFLISLGSLFPVRVPSADLIYFHLFMVGWVTQMIIGVAFWFLPKESSEKPRGNETLMWFCYWMLNAGLLLRVMFEPMLVSNTSPVAAPGLVTSAVAQWLAAIAFVFHAWKRVK